MSRRRIPLVWPRQLSLAALLLGLGLPSPGLGYMRNRGPVPSLAPGEGRFADSDITIVENLGQKVPAGLAFQDGHGHKVELDAFLGRGKPILVTLGYYRCPQLCTLVHEGLVKGLKEAGLVLGRDFLGFSASIDPNEDPKSAVTNQRRLMRALGSGETTDWPFAMPLPGSGAAAAGAGAGGETDASRLAASVGFRYAFDPKSNQFAHSAVAVVLTPSGAISRYLYGVEFKGRDLRFALVEASGGRVGTTLDRVLLTCFKYDPMTQTYTPYVFGFVRAGALLSFAALATLLAVLWRREWVGRRRRLA